MRWRENFSGKMVIDAKFKNVAHTPSTAKSTQVTILSTSNQRLIFYETKLIDKIFLFPTMQLILISYFKLLILDLFIRCICLFKTSF